MAVDRTADRRLPWTAATHGQRLLTAVAVDIAVQRPRLLTAEAAPCRHTVAADAQCRCHPMVAEAAVEVTHRHTAEAEATCHRMAVVADMPHRTVAVGSEAEGGHQVASVGAADMPRLPAAAEATMAAVAATTAAATTVTDTKAWFMPARKYAVQRKLGGVFFL